MKNMNHNMASGGREAKRNSCQYEIRGQRRQCGLFLIKSFSSSKDVLPEKRRLSRILPELAGKILCIRYANQLNIYAKLVN
jgi:hypothetical protein